ncbi:MAG TPA: helix-turn-helix domain-containing protein [Thermoleophilaceae bacterium]|jgi:AcrR family transcriptional regulator
MSSRTQPPKDTRARRGAAKPRPAQRGAAKPGGARPDRQRAAKPRPAQQGRSGAPPAAGGAGPRKRIPSGERRVLILDAALEVFARHGYHAASIDDIAGAAGVSKALIYEHFPSKRHLHAALLERHVGELFELLAASAATSEPGEVRLEAGVDAFFAYVESRPDAFRMLFRDAVEPEVAESLRQLATQSAAAVAGLIAAEPRARRADEAEEAEAIEMLGALLTGAVQSLALWWDEHPKVPRERLVARVMEFAWIGLERLRAGERFER